MRSRWRTLFLTQRLFQSIATAGRISRKTPRTSSNRSGRLASLRGCDCSNLACPQQLRLLERRLKRRRCGQRQHRWHWGHDWHAAPTCTLTVLRYQTPMPSVHPTEKFRTAGQSFGGEMPALKAARTAFNFPCVNGVAAITSTRRLRSISPGSLLPRRFCSAITADSNRSSSWSSRCLTAFGKSAGRMWREGNSLGGG
jgi:hypothetical protein